MMHNCREITALISMGLDKKLTLRERFAVWLHLLMCSGCKHFQKQSGFIRKAARSYTQYLENRLCGKS